MSQIGRGRAMAAVLVAVALSGCAAKLTLIDRTDGQIYSGATDGSTVGGNGTATVLVEGESYSGPWIYQPTGGSFGFGNFGGMSTVSGTATATGPAGLATTNISGTGTVSGMSSSMVMSAVGKGMINVRAPSGKFMRCIFSFHVIQDTGMGECMRNDGRVFDLTIKR